MVMKSNKKASQVDDLTITLIKGFQILLQARVSEVPYAPIAVGIDYPLLHYDL